MAEVNETEYKIEPLRLTEWIEKWSSMTPRERLRWWRKQFDENTDIIIEIADSLPSECWKAKNRLYSRAEIIWDDFQMLQSDIEKGELNA